MKSKALLLICCLVSSGIVFSQEPDTSLTAPPIHVQMSTPPTVISYKTPPLITIKGEELSKFPTNNFLEAISAYFPWVYKPGSSYGDYTYVVNGNVLQDINSLSLHDIEQVSFSRTNLDGRLYPFSRAGIFYIKTKEVSVNNVQVNFNTQYNAVINNKKRLVYVNNPTATEIRDDLDNKAGHFQSNHLSVSAAGRNITFYGSAQLNFIKDPVLRQTTNFNVMTNSYEYTSKETTKQLNTGTFIDLRYNNNKGTIAAGLSASYFRSVDKEDSSGSYESLFTSSTSRSEFASKSKVAFNYYHVSPYIMIQKGRLQNVTRFEYSNNKFDYDYEANSLTTVTGGSPQTFTTRGIKEVVPYTRGYAIRNDLNYELLHKGKFKVTPGVVFSYINQELRYRAEYSTWNGNNLQTISANWSYGRQKVTTLNPYIQLNFNNQFMGYAGHTFLLNKKSEIGLATTKHSRRSYYAGAIIDLVKSGIHKMNRLDISFHYGNMTKNNSKNYWLQSISDIDNFRPSSHFDGFYTGFNSAYFFRTLQTSVQINSAFLQNRLRLGAEWSKTVEDNRFLVMVPWPNYTTYVPSEVTTTGWAAYAAVNISTIRGFEWTSRINALFPKNKIDIESLSNNMIMFDYKCITGWQNNFTFGALYAQVNGMLGIQRNAFNNSTFSPPIQKETDFILNYVLLGMKMYYEKLNVFIHARNLLGTSEGKEYYGYNAYIGAGVQLTLQ